MLRAVAVVLVLVGCDQVWQLHRDIPASACGFYDDLHRVNFDGLGNDVTDLSVDGTGLRGFVQGTTSTRTGLIPVKLDGGSWIPDSRFEANLGQLGTNEFVHFGRISYTGDLFASQRSQTTGLYSVYQYRFMNSMWVLANNFAVAMSTGQTTYAGSELETMQTFGLSAQVPIIHEPNTAEPPYVGMAERPPNVTTWTEAVSGGRLSTFAINEVHEVTHAVIGRGPNDKIVLLYAARPKRSTESSDLFLSEKEGAFFPVGIPLEAVNTSDDELEPWISEDCHTLYFRRGDTIMSAEAK